MSAILPPYVCYRLHYSFSCRFGSLLCPGPLLAPPCPFLPTCADGSWGSPFPGYPCPLCLTPLFLFILLGCQRFKTHQGDQGKFYRNSGCWWKLSNGYFTVCKDQFFNLSVDNCRPDYTVLAISLFLIFLFGSRHCLLGAGALPETLEPALIQAELTGPLVGGAVAGGSRGVTGSWCVQGAGQGWRSRRRKRMVTRTKAWGRSCCRWWEAGTATRMRRWRDLVISSCLSKAVLFWKGYLSFLSLEHVNHRGTTRGKNISEAKKITNGGIKPKSCVVGEWGGQGCWGERE